jgi:hypothetical protein
LVGDYGHQFRIDLALLSQQQCNQDKEGIHDHTELLLFVQLVDIAFYHLFEHLLAIVGREQRYIKILRSHKKYLTAVDAFATEYLGQATWIILFVP